MSLLTRLRRLSRALPIDPVLLHRARRLAAVGFRASAWTKYGRSRRPLAPRPGPVCVVGFHGSVLGIGEAARAFSGALRQTGVEVADWDISALFGHDVRLDCAASAAPPAEAASLVIFLNPNELVQLIAMQGAAPFAGRFCAGAWFWELEQAPPIWRHALPYVDEVWAGSRFAADAIAALAPSKTVRVLPCPVTAPAAPADRAAFGIPADKVAVLTSFDVRSGFTRKNPIAAVRAFRAANREGRGVMICKAAGVEGAPDLVESLRAEIGEAGDVRLMTDWLTGAQMQSLTASADIVMSLHRSEGFGLGPAQAMAAGKVAIATGWSANLDFMTCDNSVLVDYALTPVEDPQGLYIGGRWAEPDIADAAAKLERLITDAPLRARLGKRAAADIRAMLDPAAIGAMAKGWLEQDQKDRVRAD
jgi:glycosyltransferase involved in cell wall biosynthesis